MSYYFIFEGSTDFQVIDFSILGSANLSQQALGIWPRSGERPFLLRGLLLRTLLCLFACFLPSPCGASVHAVRQGGWEETLLGLGFFPSLFANHRAYAFQSQPVYEVCLVSI